MALHQHLCDIVLCLQRGKQLSGAIMGICNSMVKQASTKQANSGRAGFETGQIWCKNQADLGRAGFETGQTWCEDQEDQSVTPLIRHSANWSQVQYSSNPF